MFFALYPLAVFLTILWSLADSVDILIPAGPAKQRISVGIMMTGRTMTSALQEMYGSGDERISTWIQSGMDIHGVGALPVAFTTLSLNGKDEVMPVEVHYEFTTYDTAVNELPQDPEAHDLYVFSGSHHSVNDAHEWIRNVEAFIRDVDQLARKRTYSKPVPPKMVGICFGHQLIHKALGGSVANQAQPTLGIGPHTYQIHNFEPMMLTHEALMPKAASDQVVLDVLHNDQVVQPAEGFTTLAGSDFTPYGITIKEDRILTFQPHPEYPNKTNRYVRSLLEFALESGWVQSDQVEGYQQLIDRSPFPESARMAAWLTQFIVDPRRSTELPLAGGITVILESETPKMVSSTSMTNVIGSFLWSIANSYWTKLRHIRSNTIQNV